MPLPEKYRYLEADQPRIKPQKRDAAQIRREGERFSLYIKLGGVILFVLVVIIMSAVIYYVSGMSEPLES